MLEKSLYVITIIFLIVSVLGCNNLSEKPTISASDSKNGWTIFSNGNEINALLATETDIWAATNGGVVQWNKETGTYRKYTTLDGLADNTVKTIAQDKWGNLWFATLDYGVNRFDGTEWQTYTIKDGLIDNRITAMAADNNGNLWFGALEGVSRYDGQSWSTFSFADIFSDSNNRYTTAIAADQAGKVWITTLGNVNYYDGRSWFTFDRKFNEVMGSGDLMTMVIDSHGDLFLGTTEGIKYYNGQSWRGLDYTSANGMLAIAVDHSGNLWANSANGVSMYGGQSWREFTVSEGLVDRTVYAIAIDPDGSLWFGTKKGISRYDGKSWKTYITQDGLASNLVEDLVQDNMGNIWVATYNNGIGRYDSTVWRTFSIEEIFGSSHNRITAIFADHQGNVWFNSETGVYRFEDNSFKPFIIDNRPTFIRSRDNQGTLWFYAAGDGFHRYDGSNWVTYPASPLSGFLDVAEDSEGNIWVCTEQGVSFYNGSIWKSFAIGKDIPGNGIISPEHTGSGFEGNTIVIDGHNNVWLITTGAGLIRYDGFRWQTFEDKGGPIEVDKDGNLWCGNRTGGVSRFDGKSWTRFTLTEGLVNNKVRTILVGPDNTLWFGTEGGVSHYDGISWRNLTVENGLARNSVWKIKMDHEGSLWFLTSGGISRYRQ